MPNEDMAEVRRRQLWRLADDLMDQIRAQMSPSEAITLLTFLMYNAVNDIGQHALDGVPDTRLHVLEGIYTAVRECLENQLVEEVEHAEQT